MDDFYTTGSAPNVKHLFIQYNYFITKTFSVFGEVHTKDNIKSEYASYRSFSLKYSALHGVDK